MDWFKDIEDFDVIAHPEECLLEEDDIAWIRERQSEGACDNAEIIRQALVRKETSVLDRELRWVLREYWPPLMAEIVVLLRESVMDMTFWKSPTGSPFPSGLVNLALSAANMDDIKGFVSVSGDRLVRAELYIKVHNYNRGNVTKVALQQESSLLLNQIAHCRRHSEAALQVLQTYDQSCEEDPARLHQIIDCALDEIISAREHLLHPASTEVFPMALAHAFGGSSGAVYTPALNAEYHHLDFYLSGKLLSCAFYCYKTKDAPDASHARVHRGSKETLGDGTGNGGSGGVGGSGSGSGASTDDLHGGSVSHHFRLLPRFSSRRRSSSVDAPAAAAASLRDAGEKAHILPLRSVHHHHQHEQHAHHGSKQFLTTSASQPSGLARLASSSSLNTVAALPKISSHGRKVYRVENKLVEVLEVARIDAVFPQLAKVFDALLGAEEFCRETKAKLAALQRS